MGHVPAKDLQLVSTPAAEPRTEVSEQPLPGRGRGTLLIVDDEEGPRQTLQMVFKDDYDLLLASDGPTAIALAQEHRIDVAVLDIRMQGMSGIEVLERLKYVDPRIEVVMLTAFETTETLRQAMRLRACDYLNKPFDLATMRAAVSSAMQRRMIEGEIHTDAEKLQELVKELENQKVEEQMAQTRGEIYASIIHDLNGPLTVISGFVQLLNQRVSNATRLDVEDLEFIRERLKTITRQVSNCIEISRRYLSFLRQNIEDLPRVSVNQLLTDLSHLVRVHPSRGANQFTMRPLAEDLAVRMNGTDVIQILLNLTVNAFQCSALPLTIEIEARRLETPVELTRFRDSETQRLLNVEGFSNTPPMVAFLVRDNGPGIPAEVLPKIFQPYFTTKGPRQGTGLGLNIVQRLVKEARGALHVSSEPGRGTTFTVYLPAAVFSANPS